MSSAVSIRLSPTPPPARLSRPISPSTAAEAIDCCVKAFGAVGPGALGGSPVKLHLEVEDAEAAVAAAKAHGATVQRPLRDEFHGHRQGMVADPFGYSWFLSQKIAEVTPEEMQTRWLEAVAT